VHGVTELVGKGLQAAFTKLEPLLESLVDAPPETPERETVLAALNGVMGDQLAHTHNPLATPMTLRYQGRALNLHALPAMPAATGKVLLLIHGLCMNDLQWQTSVTDDGKPQSDHGATLAAELGYTPMYLRYNTGLHTSQNGHELASMLEQLLAKWPVPVEEFTVVVHSMGGLLIRSAVHYAQRDGLRGPHNLNIVFLASHHGAPLERAATVDVIWQHAVQQALCQAGPVAQRGFTDLRWHRWTPTAGHDVSNASPTAASPPLPLGVACYAVAATAAGKRSPLADRVIGDGLVPLASALGQHPDPIRQLNFAKANQTIVYRTHHMELLHSPTVTQQLLIWLK
jgi:hypothetical protein